MALWQRKHPLAVGCTALWHDHQNLFAPEDDASSRMLVGVGRPVGNAHGEHFSASRA
jgi:hypothetical protein